jgi:hypothetical protein
MRNVSFFMLVYEKVAGLLESLPDMVLMKDNHFFAIIKI